MFSTKSAAPQKLEILRKQIFIMDIYFVSSNQGKIDEVNAILTSPNISVYPVSLEIHEIQSNDIKKIVFDKARKAFRQIERPVLVEQTGLFITDFGNLPGGLTQIFWDSLESDKFGKIFSNIGSGQVTAKTVLAYCDGKHIHTFEGEIDGHIVYPPRGSRTFQWDCVFQPIGYDKTFAELGEAKNDFSMRKIALTRFKSFLEENHD